MRFSKSGLKTAILLAFAGAVLTSSTAMAEVVLHRGNGGEPQTLDQAHTSIDVEANILKDLYEGLTVYDAAGNVIPGIAESWTVSDDGLTYTFKLRADAKWSNGDPVTAGDFVYSFRRIEDPKTAAGYANILYPIKNAEAINTGKDDKAMAPDQLGMQGGRRQDAGDHRRAADALFPRAAGAPDGIAGPAGQRREVRRGLRQARQHGLRRRLHARPRTSPTTTSRWSRTRTTTTPPTSRSTRSSTIRPRTRRPPSAASRRANSTCSTSSPPTRWRS